MKNEERSYVIMARHDAIKDGFVHLDITFLLHWIGPTRSTVYGDALTAMSGGRRSASMLYSSRAVLRLWASMKPNGPDYIRLPSDDSVLVSELHALRLQNYQTMAEEGRRLTTANNRWSSFLVYLKYLAAAGELPALNFTRLVSALPKDLHTTDADQARAGLGDPTTYPKSYVPEDDSFHSGLIVPISISRTSDEYVTEYATQLGSTISSIRAAALGELKTLRGNFEEGKTLREIANYPAIKKAFTANRARGPGRYIDPRNGKHFFDPAGGHPNLLRNLLGLIDTEMRGIPRSRVSEKSINGKRKKKLDQDGGGHWLFVGRYGKNRLLPYLGILTSRTMVPFFVTLLLEHPSLTVSSLLRARLSNEKGTAFLVNTSDGRSGTTISLEKPRAVSFKEAELTPLSKFALDLLLDMTNSTRTELRTQGRKRDANYLWIGMHMIDYRLIRVSEGQLTTSFRNHIGSSSQRGGGRSCRMTSFVDTHLALSKMRSTLTLKSIRVSVGIMRYVTDGENLVAASRSLGHRDAQTTIDHYVPTPFQIALYEHKIRRHQNLLLALTALDANEMLRFTDFSSVEELNCFLESQTGSIAEQLKSSKVLKPHWSGDSTAQKQRVLSPPGNKNELVIHNEKHAVAVAILYRERLIKAPKDALHASDPFTGIAPIAWIELIDALLSPLPNSMASLRELVRTAIDHASRLRGLINFPEV